MSGRPTDSELIIVGWRELVALPEWNIPRLRAKIDTGARTSAIHVAGLEEVDDERVAFQVVVRERPSRKTVWVEARKVRESVVKPSSGRGQRRIVCRTRMRLGPIERDIEVSLVCRKGMLCRMLIGRTALSGIYAVDPSRKYVTRPPGPGRKPK